MGDQVRELVPVHIIRAATHLVGGSCSVGIKGQRRHIHVRHVEGVGAEDGYGDAPRLRGLMSLAGLSGLMSISSGAMDTRVSFGAEGTGRAAKPLRPHSSVRIRSNRSRALPSMAIVNSPVRFSPGRPSWTARQEKGYATGPQRPLSPDRQYLEPLTRGRPRIATRARPPTVLHGRSPPGSCQFGPLSDLRNLASFLLSHIRWTVERLASAWSDPRRRTRWTAGCSKTRSRSGWSSATSPVPGASHPPLRSRRQRFAGPRPSVARSRRSVTRSRRRAPQAVRRAAGRSDCRR